MSEAAAGAGTAKTIRSPLHHGPVVKDQCGTSLIAFYTSNGSLVVNGQA